MQLLVSTKTPYSKGNNTNFGIIFRGNDKLISVIHSGKFWIPVSSATVHACIEFMRQSFATMYPKAKPTKGKKKAPM